MLAGDRLALARLITLVENRSPLVPEIMRRLHPRTGRAYTVGVTGPPGAGKSTLVDGLTARLRKEEATVGVIAVDPTSPFTGGAVLGDRIRMQSHTLDPGCSSAAWRPGAAWAGWPGGPPPSRSSSTPSVFDRVLVETVGVGQSELDVMKLADTIVVVLVPESGDAIQTMKAGLLEVADILVVNKADRDGAPALVTELRYMVHLHGQGRRAARDLDWEVPGADHGRRDGRRGGRAARGDRPPPGGARGERGPRRPAAGAPGRGAAGAGAGRAAPAVDDALADGGPLAPVVADVEAGRTDPYTAVRTIAARIRLDPRSAP